MHFIQILLPVLMVCHLSNAAHYLSELKRVEKQRGECIHSWIPHICPTSKTPPSKTSPTPSSEQKDPEQVEEAANAMFEEYWQSVLNDSPETATMMGDRRHEDRLDCYSLKCYEKRKVVLRDFLQRGNQMLPLAKEGSITHNNIEHFVTNMQNTLNHLMSGDYLFPMSKLSTPLRGIRSLMKYMKLNVSQDYWNLISRYRAIPVQIDEQIELMREGIRTNFTLNNHSMFYNVMDSKINVEDTPFYKPFLNVSNFVQAEEIAELQTNASDAISNAIVPAYEKLSNFLKNEYRKHLRPDIGASTLPNGHEYYRQQLAHHLTGSKVTPKQVHEMGLSEVERISKELDEVIRSLNLSMTRKEFSEELRNNKSNFFNSEDEALETYRNMLDNEIRPKLPFLFNTIPLKKLTVEKVPSDVSSGPRVYYMPASPDGSTPATFYLDTSSPENLPKYEVVTLALHEGEPGHHFQISYAMERDDAPEFRKHDIGSSAFVEGWALYAEYLGEEMGLYSDPKMWYGHLSEEIFRACRMVVDTGIHEFGWSRRKAIDYIMDNSATTQDNVEREVDRYITWPGQACAYKFGEMKIKEFRLKAENELGTHFDVKEFHDVVLNNNGPIELLEQQVDRYINTAKESFEES